MVEKQAKNDCGVCSKPSYVPAGETCCPEKCQRCEKKKCTENDACQCSICHCGCLDGEIRDLKCGEHGCPQCRIKCTTSKRCQCTLCDCGCEPIFRQGKLCYEANEKCKDCKEKCKDSTDGDCICGLCNCGCNGAMCSCCSWCNPGTKCPGEGECDGKEQHSEECKSLLGGRGKEHDAGKYYCRHAKEAGTCKPENCDNTEYFYVSSKCTSKCTNCGKLCPQDAFLRLCYIGVPILLIVAIMVSVCRLYPGPFRKVYYGLRATFVDWANSSGASTNLAGGRIHEEIDTDEYSAFPFKGLM
ncbi:hypothetical protein, conserved [Babesia ovata]|uniref:Uncharacterized protein n=1 Tax=Babesia ovata TaxID=189622 RepID=A0A2H6K883_9APIC|nr:uncharacterized protein BOVATA_006990 [Babesia ovata]GBE59206.1 hypothetical protein, conserved [Babesia ovata]